MRYAQTQWEADMESFRSAVGGDFERRREIYARHLKMAKTFVPSKKNLPDDPDFRIMSGTAIALGALDLLDGKSAAWRDFAMGCLVQTVEMRLDLFSRRENLADMQSSVMACLGLYLSNLNDDFAETIELAHQNTKRFLIPGPRYFLPFARCIHLRCAGNIDEYNRFSQRTQLGPFAKLVKSLDEDDITAGLEAALDYHVELRPPQKPPAANGKTVPWYVLRAKTLTVPWLVFPVDIYAWLKLRRELGHRDELPKHLLLRALPPAPKDIREKALTPYHRFLLEQHGGLKEKVKYMPVGRKKKRIAPIAELEAAIAAGDEAAVASYASEAYSESRFLADRGSMDFFLQAVCDQLKDKNFRIDEDPDEGFIHLRYGKVKTVSVPYKPAETLQERLVVGVAQALNPTHEARAFASSQGSTDTLLLIRPPDWWRAQEKKNGKLVKKLFLPVETFYS